MSILVKFNYITSEEKRKKKDGERKAYNFVQKSLKC